MIDKKTFTELKKRHGAYQVSRRKIIGQSNEMLNLSKRSIFSMHRGDIKGADRQIAEAKKMLDELTKMIGKEVALRFEGAYRAGLEEHTEAVLFQKYLKDGKIGKLDSRLMDPDVYYAGLADFTGELVRYAIALATKGEVAKIKGVKQGVERIVEHLLELNLTGQLRNKFDQAKRNLRKMEEILYDLTIKR